MPRPSRRDFRSDPAPGERKIQSFNHDVHAVLLLEPLSQSFHRFSATGSQHEIRILIRQKLRELNPKTHSRRPLSMPTCHSSCHLILPSLRQSVHLEPDALRRDAVQDDLPVLARYASGLLDCAGLHIDQFPDMAIQVLKSMSVHKAVMLRFLMGLATGGYCFANERIDFLPDLSRQAYEHLGAFR